MKKRLRIWIMCLAALVLTACGGAAPEAPQTESPDLLDTVRAALSGDTEDAYAESDADLPEWEAWTEDDTASPEQYAWTEDDTASPDADAPQWDAWTVADAPDEQTPLPSASDISEDGAYTAGSSGPASSICL